MAKFGGLDIIGGLVDLGTAIAGAITGSQQEKDYRSSWTQQTASDLQTQNPTKNIMVVDSDHDASGLVGVEKKNIGCTCPTGATISYTAYVFDSGPFHLKGDGYGATFSAN